ncbi:methyltransferase-like protein 25 isoform X2 [Mizuhopecten yessoensis]|uniref:methyltransferase-like protein 25 isoform X2 n=1 Tax=Mizuhopecten yessoensis TaxID=6573 RepID=UPI000B45D6F2|nr:methyltransferase-like protein 25 isoform X2 [Mizuhopecten yessoensis]
MSLINNYWCDVLLDLSTEDLNKLPYGEIRDKWPDSLKNFIRTALTLSLPRSPRKGTTSVTIDHEMQRGMTPKKQHEVTLMSSVVHDVARRADCDVILDIGSGLGYLGQILQKQFGYRIIGFESKQCHTSGAEKRVCHTDHNNGIQNVTFELEKGQENRDKFSELVYNTCHVKGQSIATDKSVRKPETCINSENDGKCDDDVCDNKTFVQNISGSDDLVLKQPDGDDLVLKQPDCDDLVLKQPLSVTVEGRRCDEDCVSNVSTGYLESCQKCKYNSQHEGHTIVIKNPYFERCKACDIEIDNLTLKQPAEFSDVCSSCQQNRNLETQVQVLRHSPDFNGGCECGDDMVDKASDPQSTLTQPVKPLTLTSPRALMIGLHCCGDLTPTMMEYFRCLDFVRGLCCVSCCYHRMKVKATNEIPFNFPMTAATAKIYQRLRGDNPGWSLSTFAMRLAAQETRGRWGQQTAKDHDYHTKNVGYRGILELYTHTKSQSCAKVFRKIARKSDFSSFTAYIDAASSRLGHQAGLESGIDREELNGLFEKYKDKMKYIEPLTALQYLLQPVLEGLINTDRAQYLHDHDITAEIVPIFDEIISPRNLALISVK